VLTVAATVSLGRWQLSRAAQKEALQASIDAEKQKPPLDQAEFLALPQASDALHRPVRLRGLWLTPQTVYLDNRQMHGVPGFYVLTPFALEGTEQTVMVQRGWVQRNFVDRTKLGAVETPAGIVEVTGLIEPPPSHLLELGASAAAAAPAPASAASAPRGTGRRGVFGHPAKSRPGGLPRRDQAAAAHRRVAAADRPGLRGPAARLAGPGAGAGEALRLRIPVVRPLGPRRHPLCLVPIHHPLPPLKAPRTRWPLLTSRWA
jgi:cytochrome oxidase assembly protein ShyY1